MSVEKVQLNIEGMHCGGCEAAIADILQALPGVQVDAVSYAEHQAKFSYDNRLIDLHRVQAALAARGYQADPRPAAAGVGRLWSVLAFVLLLIGVGGVTFWGKSLMPDVMRQIGPHMDRGLLLGLGFLTGFHCIGMCGGFVVGYTDPTSGKFRQALSHLVYGLSKTASYAVIGAGFGLLGALIAITPTMRAVAALAASLFLVLYGLKMLNVFGWLRHFGLRGPAGLNRQVREGLRRRPRSPLATGLLTGLLLGCGPLQAMYVMAAGSGDPLQGATILSLFGLGTLPPLLGFGLFATLLPAGVMRQLLKVSALLLITMGVMMGMRGMKMLKAAPADPAAAMHGQMH